MTWTGCEEFLWWFCKKQASDPEFRERLREAMASPVDPLRAFVRLVKDTDATMAPIAEQEIGDLPDLAVSTMLKAWLEAVSRGKAFEAHSEPPQRVIEFARRRMVRITVDEDQDSIQVRLAHVPNHHPRRV
jgi:hypothetical protein